MGEGSITEQYLGCDTWFSGCYDWCCLIDTPRVLLLLLLLLLLFIYLFIILCSSIINLF